MNLNPRLQSASAVIGAAFFATVTLSVAEISAAECPCTAPTTLGLSVNGRSLEELNMYVDGLSPGRAAAFLDSLRQCHAWREHLGIYTNYCREPLFMLLLRSGPDSAIGANRSALRSYYCGVCKKFLHHHADVPNDSAGEYWRGENTPLVLYSHPMNGRSLVYGGIVLAAVGGGVLLPVSIVNGQQVRTYSKPDVDYVYLNTLFSKLGAIVLTAVSAVVVAGGSVMLTIGSIKQREGAQFDEQKRQLELSVTPEGAVGVRYTLRW
jgi:hypothetical protein